MRCVAAPLATSSWLGLRTACIPLDVTVRNVPRATHHGHSPSALFPLHLLLLSLAQLPHRQERQSSTRRDLFPPLRERRVLSLLPLPSRFPPLIDQQLHLACKPNGFGRARLKYGSCSCSHVCPPQNCSAHPAPSGLAVYDVPDICKDAGRSRGSPKHPLPSREAETLLSGTLALLPLGP